MQARMNLKLPYKYTTNTGMYRKTAGIDEAKKKTAVRMLKKGKLSVEEVAEYSELAISEVQQLAKDL